MKVTPTHAAIGTFFMNSPMFRVPKYQRSYAWDEEEISDFLQDLTECYENRKGGNPINHFFGGMVSVGKNVPGIVQGREYELVDGQQRCSTFVLTIAAILYHYKKILDVAKAKNETKNITLINGRIKKLKERFIEFEIEKNRQTSVVEALILSKVDQQFFCDTIRSLNPIADRASHDRIKYAYDKLIEKIGSLLTDINNVPKTLDELEHLTLIIDIDFSILHIETDSEKEAYRLFQVLNDRGKSLSEGDLLRAKTLEILEPFQGHQTTVENYWDNILIDSPKDIENYLRWIYQSFKGGRAGRNTLFDDFLEEFYPENILVPLDQGQADKVRSTTKSLSSEVIIAKKISQGTWPFTPSDPPTMGWDRNRLSLVIRELNLKVCLPILLASYHLGEKKFSEVVQILERFLFRYKVIANQHIEAAVAIFHRNCLLIRNNPANYRVNALKTELKTLLDARVNDAQFRAQLDGLEYKKGGGNRPLKYFLITLEYYKRWYDNGANGQPKCMDKTILYDFASTTIEHVYPQNASAANIDAALEESKQSLGNLTIMGPNDNNIGANNSFATKQPIFQQSSVGLNTNIGALAQWDLAELNQRQNDLIDMACSIFSL